MCQFVRITLLAFIVGATAQAGWLEGWLHRYQFEIDAAQIEEELHDFPLLVRLTPDNFDFPLALDNGLDIRFTAGDGVTPLQFERESHNASGALAIYWVRLPLVSATTNTPLYLYFGNRQASDASETATVWDQHHLAVWHLNSEGDGQQYDSTANQHHLTNYGAVKEGTPGPLGANVTMYGTDDAPEYLINPQGAYPAIDTSAGLTFSAWGMVVSNESYVVHDYITSMISLGGGNWNPWWTIRMGPRPRYSYLSATGPDYGTHGIGAAGFTRDQWHHAAMTLAYDEASDSSTLKVFLNGKLHASQTKDDYNVFTNRALITTRPLVIGATTWSS